MIGEKQLRRQLSPSQDVIFRLLWRGRDVSIETLFSRLYPEQQRTPTARQKALGPHLSRLNSKLCEHGWIVRPGTARRTYKLYPLELAPKKVHGRKAARR